jgi:hypothetical protein
MGAVIPGGLRAARADSESGSPSRIVQGDLPRPEFGLQAISGTHLPIVRLLDIRVNGVLE